MTIRLRRQLIVLPFLLLTISCEDFQTSAVPIVEAGKGAHPMAEGQYDFFPGGPEVKVPIQTGVLLVKVDAHYEVRYVSTSKTTVGPEALRMIFASQNLTSEENAELMEFCKHMRQQSEFDLLSSIDTINIAASSLDSSVQAGTLTSRQKSFLARVRGFALGPLDGDYYIFQTPIAFAPSEWPASDNRPTPSWTIKLARVGARSIEFLEAADAFLSASKALFGAKRTCDNNGECKDEANVKRFTDTAELNRQIVLRAVREFARELKPYGRLVRVD